jgi:hypothetical protein
LTWADPVAGVSATSSAMISERMMPPLSSLVVHP